MQGPNPLGPTNDVKFGSQTTGPHTKLVHLLGLTCYNIITNLQINYKDAGDVIALKGDKEEQDESLSPYAMFKYSIRSELTLKYYERRLSKFLDFIQFETGVKEIEKRCNDFIDKGKSDVNWTIGNIIRFLQFQNIG